MKRFSFSLEKVRDWRELQEETERARLEVLLAGQRRLIRELVEIDQDRDDADLAALVSADPLQIGILDRYRDFLDRRKIKLERECTDINARIDQQRSRLTGARRNVELLDRLKGKALEKWQYQFNREIEEQAADSALTGWRQRNAA